ncbi:MAG: trypsin-like peptidase domain-containing protein [Planctomycetota bacterium]|nr:trypsin-like peptidase domain-containing protein [Planctomycetota bacterium]
MQQRSNWILWALTLSIGIGLGASLDSWSLTSKVSAKALDARESERLYRELNADTGALIDGSRLLSKVAKLTTPTVVRIESQRRTRGRTVEETGSGVIMEHKTAAGFFVVTNRHVVNGSTLEDIAIHLHDGRVITPKRIWQDQASDIAVLSIEGTNLQSGRWGDSDQLDIGHMVLAMGSPFGLSSSVTYGIISAKGRRSLKLGSTAEVINQNFLQTDAAINPGNSGGPLIDLHGRVIGINTAIASSSGGNDGIGFSIPSSLVQRVVDQLLMNGRVQRAYLGIKLDPDFDAASAYRLKLDRPRGARIMEVYSNTPASKARLQVDDVIVEFNGRKVEDHDHLINLVSLTGVSRTIPVIVIRNGQRLTISVLLGDRADLQQRSELPASRPDMGVPVELMGLTVHELEADVARQLGHQKNAGGVIVLKVDSNGPMKGQIELYDVIEEVARRPIQSVNDLRQTLADQPSSGSLLVRVSRQVEGENQSRVIVWQR